MTTNMSMIDYVKKVVLENYANFEGRANRPEYWWFTLFNILVSVGINLLSLVIPFIGIIGGLYALATLIPGIAVGVRRMHDINKSGWFLLVGLIPLIGWIWIIVLLVKEGDAGANQYGANPDNPMEQNFDFEQQKLQM